MHNNKTNLQESPNPFFLEKQEQGWEEQQQVYTQVKVVLNSSIQEPEHYTALINRIDNLGEGDALILQLDNIGGNVDGCLALVDAIENTPADVIAVLSGRVYSAASIIALRCPQIQVGPYARMMIHSWSGGNFGKHNEVVADYEFNQKFLKSFFYDTYKYFLTDKEIEEVLNGRDVWLDGDAIQERLERKNELLQKEYKKQQQEAKKLANAVSEGKSSCCSSGCSKDKPKKKPKILDVDMLGNPITEDAEIDVNLGVATAQ